MFSVNGLGISGATVHRSRLRASFSSTSHVVIHFSLWTGALLLSLIVATCSPLDDCPVHPAGCLSAVWVMLCFHSGHDRVEQPCDGVVVARGACNVQHLVRMVDVKVSLRRRHHTSIPLQAQSHRPQFETLGYNNFSVRASLACHGDCNTHCSDLDLERILRRERSTYPDHSFH